MMDMKHASLRGDGTMTGARHKNIAAFKMATHNFGDQYP